MGGGGGHGAFLRKDANLADVENVEESQKNLELFDDRANTFLGEEAGKKLKEPGSIGDGNTALGRGALQQNTTGELNTALGVSALQQNTTGITNTALGVGALQQNTTGDRNTAVGANALGFNKTGNANTVIGDGADTSNPNDSNSIVIGAGAKGNGNGSIQIGQILNTSTFIGGNGPSAIRDASGQEIDGFQLYVLSTGEIVRGAAVNPIP